MTDAELQAWEATRDLEAELVESARQIAQGETAAAYSPVIAARKGAAGLAQRVVRVKRLFTAQKGR